MVASIIPGIQIKFIKGCQVTFEAPFSYLIENREISLNIIKNGYFLYWSWTKISLSGSNSSDPKKNINTSISTVHFYGWKSEVIMYYVLLANAIAWHRSVYSYKTKRDSKVIPFKEEKTNMKKPKGRWKEWKKTAKYLKCQIELH